MEVRGKRYDYPIPALHALTGLLFHVFCERIFDCLGSLFRGHRASHNTLNAVVHDRAGTRIERLVIVELEVFRCCSAFEQR